MSPRCAHPELQGQILEAARARHALDLELSLHAAGCRACRTAAERLRRMVAVWEVDRDDDRCAAAAERFVARLDRAELRSPRPPAFFAAVGAAAAALLLALGGPRLARHSPRSVAEISPSSVSSAGPDIAARPLVAPAAMTAPVALPVRQGGHVRGPRGVVDLADGTRVELRQGESARIMLADGTTSDLRGPCLVEFWSSTSEVGGWKLSYLPVASELHSVPAVEEPPQKHRCDSHDARCRPGTTVAKEGSEAPANPASPSFAPVAIADPQLDRAWARAAEALRRDDFAAADQAFGDLEHAGDGVTRDAARLARAQLWIAHGRGASARAILEDLSANGATPLVRQRAAEFLGRASP